MGKIKKFLTLVLGLLAVLSFAAFFCSCGENSGNGNGGGGNDGNGHSITSAEDFETDGTTLKSYFFSDDGNYDLRNKFTVSKGASWRAFSSAECSQPTEITQRVAKVSYGWNDVYVMVENGATYESTVYNLRLYRVPVTELKLWEDDTYSVKKGVDCEEVIIPAEYNGKKITELDNSAFSYCKSITRVFLSDNITEIDYECFMGCSNLASINIPKNIVKIRARAFSDCDRLVEFITDKPYSEVADYKSEPPLLIHDGESLVDITDDGYMFMPYEGRNYLFGYVGNEKFLKLPDEYKGDSYDIYDNAFSGYGRVVEIDLGNGVKNLGKEIFNGCGSLVSITLGSGIEKLDYMTFNFTRKTVEIINKTNIEITPDSDDYYWLATSFALFLHDGKSKVDKKGDFLFTTYEDTNYLVGYVGDEEKVVLPDNYNGENYEIYQRAFSGNRELKELVIPGKGVTKAGERAISYCENLTSISFGGTTELSGYLIFNCHNLTEIRYTDDLASWCKVSKNDVLEKSTVYVDGKKLEGEIVIPAGAEEIAATAFAYCKDVTAIKIESGVKKIGAGAFKECKNLVNVEIADTVTMIGEGAFKYCEKLEKAAIPDSVTDIGKRAFSSCSGLKELTIGKGVKKIGERAFGSCKSLTSLVIPGNVVEIGENAFYDCENVKELTIENGVQIIGQWAFERCGITSLVIPGSVKTIQADAFSECKELKSIVIEEGLKTIGISVFTDCPKLVTAEIAASVTFISGSAFRCWSTFRSTPLTITYKGTKAQWRVFAKGYFEFYDKTNIGTIHCVDGDIDSSNRYSD